MARNQDAGPLPSPMVGGDDVIAQIQALVGPHSFDYEGPAAVADPMLKAGLDNSPIYHPLGVGGRVAQTVAGAIMARKAAEMHSKSAQGQAAANAALEQAKMKQTLALKQYEEEQQNKRQDKSIAETAKDRAAQRELGAQQRQETLRHNKAEEDLRTKQFQWETGTLPSTTDDGSAPPPRGVPHVENETDQKTKVAGGDKLLTGADRESMQVQPTSRKGMFNAPPEGTVKGSWFGQYRGWHDPDSGTQTASGISLNEPGIALPSRKTLGQWFDVTAPNGKTMRVRQTDLGPAKWTGRGVDITASLADKFGYKPGNFPTDEGFKVRPASGPQEDFKLAGEERPVKRGLTGAPPTPKGRPDDMGPGVTPQSKPPLLGQKGVTSQHVPNNDPRALKALYGNGYGPPIVSPKAIAADQGKPGNSPGIHIAEGPNGEKLPIEYHPDNPSLQRLGNVQPTAERETPHDFDYTNRDDVNRAIDRLNAHPSKQNMEAAQKLRDEYIKHQYEVTGKQETKDIERYSKMEEGFSGAGQAARDAKQYGKIANSAIDNPQFYSGSAAQAVLALKKLGVAAHLLPRDAATPMEVIQKVTAANIQQQIEQLKAEGAQMGAAGGRIFANQAALMEKASQNIELSPAGNKYLTKLNDWMADQNIRMADFANQYKREHKHLDANFEHELAMKIDKDPAWQLPDDLMFNPKTEKKAESKEPHDLAHMKPVMEGGHLRMRPTGPDDYSPDIYPSLPMAPIFRGAAPLSNAARGMFSSGPRAGSKILESLKMDKDAPFIAKLLMGEQAIQHGVPWLWHKLTGG